MLIRRRSIEDAACFEPDAVSALSGAFEEVCRALNIGTHEAHNREVIAVRIIELARNGAIDAKALCNRVLSESKVAA